jgi:4-amino-4-deoxy-L-arabinose transferase-like glycosyltransferase
MAQRRLAACNASPLRRVTMTFFPLSLARPDETTAVRRVAAAVVVLTLVRLGGLALSNVDLFFDESQYWVWSRDLAFGYFSKPPLLAWVIAAAEHVCGDAEACIRAPAPLMYLATSLFAFAIGRSLYDSQTGLWSALLTAFGTGTAFSARIISTDVPLVLFWALALLAYVRLRQGSGWGWAVVLGLAIGAGMLSKYAMAYFLAGMVLAAALDPAARALLRRRKLWFAIAVAILIVSPNLAWNAANGFLTLRHAGDAVIDEAIEPSLLRPLEFLAAQFAVFGPVVLAVAIAAMIGWRATRPADRVLLAFATPPLAVVTSAAFAVHAYAKWAAASFVSLAVLAAAILVRRKMPLLLWASVGLGVAVQLALLAADAYAPYMREPWAPERNPYYNTLGWKGFAQTAGALARRLAIPTIASEVRSEVASLLYYRRDQPEQIRAWPTAALPTFDSTRALAADAPQPVLFVTTCPASERLEAYYAKVAHLGIFVPQDPVARAFHAFSLEEPRRPIGALAPCPP